MCRLIGTALVFHAQDGARQVSGFHDSMHVTVLCLAAAQLQNVFSSTKVVTSLVVAMLADRGQLGFGDTLASHWPEFGAHGKERLTVAGLMRHEAGLPSFTEPVRVEALTPAAIRAGEVSALIAAQKPDW